LKLEKSKHDFHINIFLFAIAVLTKGILYIELQPKKGECRMLNTLLKIKKNKTTATYTKYAVVSKILKIISALLLAAITWNIILSDLIYKNPGTIRDNTLGKIYKPGTLVNSDEGFCRTQINSLGMRNKEISSKGLNEKRILVLGDSYTEGIQVNDDSLYTMKLEKSLREKYDEDISIVNGGRSGASPANYVYLSQFYNSQVNSDYTVIQINDADWVSDIFNKNQNFYIKEESGNFQVLFNNYISSSPVLSRFPQLSFLLKFNNSALLNYINIKLKKINQSKSSGEMKTSEKTVDAKDIEEASDWIIKELKARYSNIIFLYIPTIDYNNYSTEYTPIEELINAKCDKYGIDFIDVRKEFINHYIQCKQPAYGFNNSIPGIGHMNAIGHSIVANKLEAYFEGRIK
jgi:hypothetical protein